MRMHVQFQFWLNYPFKRLKYQYILLLQNFTIQGINMKKSLSALLHWWITVSIVKKKKWHHRYHNTTAFLCESMYIYNQLDNGKRTVSVKNKTYT